MCVWKGRKREGDKDTDEQTEEKRRQTKDRQNRVQKTAEIETRILVYHMQDLNLYINY